LKEKNVKFRITVNGNLLLLDIGQLESLVDVLAGAEHLTESHVGSNLGSQGYQNSFVPLIKPVVANDIFNVVAINQDYIDTIKLSMKLNEQTSKNL
jgi:aerobic-type carbon monoxide dehydrogenase small subunit (CoxS/CutS family)